MAFTWGRKKPKEVPDETPLVSDDGTWHEWEAAGRKLLESGDLVRAVEHLCQAVDRFDGASGEMGRLLVRIRDSAMKLARDLSEKERAFAAYLLAIIDEEVRVKYPDMDAVGNLCDMVADSCEAEISRCTGPGEVVMYSTDALYACMGFVIHSPDVREDMIRCARASEICSGAAEAVKGMKKGSGHTLPKEAATFLDIYARYADSVKAAIGEAVRDMSESDLDQLALLRTDRPVDSVPYLFEALDAANHTAVKGKLTRRKNEDKWHENVKLFVDQKISFDE